LERKRNDLEKKNSDRTIDRKEYDKGIERYREGIDAYKKEIDTYKQHVKWALAHSAMELLDLWNVFRFMFLPTALFVATASAAVWGVARATIGPRVAGMGTMISAFGVLGGVLGVATGASRDSGAISAVLPALLTFMTAVLGYSFGTSGLRRWRPILPHCVLVMTVTAFLGLFVGSGVRGKYEDFQRNYDRRLLHYKEVELPVERERALMTLRGQLTPSPSPTRDITPSPLH
jgi:hypothetical protein